jgi:hypothetical protein
VQGIGRPALADRGSVPGHRGSDADPMRRLPSPWSIVWTDNVCFRITTLTPWALIFALMVKLTGTLPGRRNKPDVPVDPGVASTILACAGVLALVLAGIVVLRVSRIRGLFERGREDEACVRKVKRFRGGATLKLELERAGVTHQARYTFQRWSNTPLFEEGTRVSVVVDPAHPKRVLPLALFSEACAAPGGSAGEPLESRRESKSSGLQLGRRVQEAARPRGER